MLAVAGMPDPSKGEALVLLTTEAVSSEQLRASLLNAGFSSLWVPRIIKHVAKIPMLGSGKLDLKSCRELARAAAAEADVGKSLCD